MKRSTRIALTALGGLAAAAALAPLFIRVAPLADTLPPEKLADEDSRFLTLRGIHLHYSDAGEAPQSLFILHGFGESIAAWRHLQRPLGEHFRVVAVDRPGFGLTERVSADPRDPVNPYGVAGQTELFSAMLTELQAAPAVVVAHSAGAAIALRLAIMHPEQVRALVLVGAAVYTVRRTLGIWRRLMNTRWANKIGILAMRISPRLFGHIAERSWHDYSKAGDAYVDMIRYPLRSEDWDRGLWEAARVLPDTSILRRLGEVRMPVLVITGDNDRLVPPADARSLVNALPNAILSVIPNCGHLPHEECPDEFLAELFSFAAKLPPETPQQHLSGTAAML
ncbi:MAG: alpha/beta hydrolase [Chloroflexi bacterium]|nr:alpha/beta hydrolase [Chloroflexota bacterium]